MVSIADICLFTLHEELYYDDDYKAFNTFHTTKDKASYYITLYLYHII